MASRGYWRDIVELGSFSSWLRLLLFVRPAVQCLSVSTHTACVPIPSGALPLCTRSLGSLAAVAFVLSVQMPHTPGLVLQKRPAPPVYQVPLCTCQPPRLQRMLPCCCISVGQLQRTYWPPSRLQPRPGQRHPSFSFGEGLLFKVYSPLGTLSQLWV